MKTIARSTLAEYFVFNAALSCYICLRFAAHAARSIYLNASDLRKSKIVAAACGILNRKTTRKAEFRFSTGKPMEIEGFREVGAFRRKHCEVRTYTAIFESTTDDAVRGWIPEIPGATGMGQTIEDAEASLKAGLTFGSKRSTPSAPIDSRHTHRCNRRSVKLVKRLPLE